MISAEAFILIVKVQMLLIFLPLHLQYLELQ